MYMNRDTVGAWVQPLLNCRIARLFD
jgi:hypothetical protein